MGAGAFLGLRLFDDAGIPMEDAEEFLRVGLHMPSEVAVPHLIAVHQAGSAEVARFARADREPLVARLDQVNGGFARPLRFEVFEAPDADLFEVSSAVFDPGRAAPEMGQFRGAFRVPGWRRWVNSTTVFFALLGAVTVYFLR
ncbi:hypothetical protein IV417_06785 [Alphaproteobacteria bacterium KMM 3653]|uniref:Uncharacterized protein n=1 Tax=Harenicola maris TaxID=2841044 RepID=A0AAP2CMK5_9RHOB|nr:hypothetical protein [Harenicola maris]